MFTNYLVEFARLLPSGGTLYECLPCCSGVREAAVEAMQVALVGQLLQAESSLQGRQLPGAQEGGALLREIQIKELVSPAKYLC